ncbi:hypothetical protein MSEO_44370 [Mycobacterium seoulense]|uniref:Uncharacterized protein n=1 Tax=Mycobacterium seoulense TaxID=386911 RepID=A0A7I7P895_9MYCO|nr:hypothetical protein MSEO_44370 [Mycobacterium seoulense]
MRDPAVHNGGYSCRYRIPNGRCGSARRAYTKCVTREIRIHAEISYIAALLATPTCHPSLLLQALNRRTGRQHGSQATDRP